MNYCEDKSGPQIANTFPVQYTRAKNNESFQGFHPWTLPLRRLRVTGWLARWIQVSPAFDF